jgi:uncharacterized membrane protein
MSPNGDDEKLPDAGTSTSADEIGAEAAALSRIETVSIRWEAPLPPPALLEQYDQVVPGLARDIARQAQVEASHVRERDQEALKAAVRYHARGQWMGFIAVLGIIGLAAFALWMGSKWVAGIATSIVVGTAAVFVLGTLRRKGKKERE